MVGRRNGASRYLIHGRECHFGWCAVKRINYLTIFVNKPHDLHIYAINYHSAIKMFLFKRRFSILFFFFARYPDIFRSFCFGSCQRLHIVTNAFKTFAACHIVTSPFCQCEGIEEKTFKQLMPLHCDTLVLDAIWLLQAKILSNVSRSWCYCRFSLESNTIKIKRVMRRLSFLRSIGFLSAQLLLELCYVA